jgi:hypothetical protein
MAMHKVRAIERESSAETLSRRRGVGVGVGVDVGVCVGASAVMVGVGVWGWGDTVDRDMNQQLPSAAKDGHKANAHGQAWPNASSERGSARGGGMVEGWGWVEGWWYLDVNGWPPIVLCISLLLAVTAR